MGKDRFLQGSHVEYRYTFRPDLALQLRDFLGEYLELDEHGVGRPDFAYPVHSYYLDSDRWTLYWQTIRRAAPNPLLRVRFYDDHPENPVYFEVKRSCRERIEKHVAFLREAWVHPEDPWLRVTVDRQLQCEFIDQPRLTTHLIQPRSLLEKESILELKFAGTAPNWFEDLINGFHLRPCISIKFVACVAQLAGPAFDGSDTSVD